MNLQPIDPSPAGEMWHPSGTYAVAITNVCQEMHRELFRHADTHPHADEQANAPA